MADLTKEQIKFIVSHRRKKTARQIAKALDVSRSDVEKVLSDPGAFRTETGHGSFSLGNLFKDHPFAMRSAVFFILLLLVAVALFVRRDVYLMPHLRGDQRFYLGTAMKLDRDGIKGYSLRGIDIKQKDAFFAYFDHSRPGDRGSILRNLSMGEGVHYYDMPVLTTPPLFSYALMFSYRMFSQEDKFTIPNVKWEPGNDLYTAKQYAGKQFYAVIVPLFFSMLLILTVFFLGKHLFGVEAGIWAAFLLTICPTDILTSQKVWADDMTAFFVALALLLFLKARKHKSMILSVLAGCSAGLGATTKATGGFVVFVIVLFHIWTQRENILKGRVFPVLFDKNVLLFLIAGLVTITPWYGLITRTYGAPWYMREAGLIETDAPWFVLIRARPWFLYLVNIPAQTPLLFLGYLVLLDLFAGKKARDGEVLVFLWFVLYLFLLRKTREERYMLPAIPALAMASGLYLRRIRLWLQNRVGMTAALTVMLIAAIVCAVWSVPLGRDVVLRDDALIRFPF